MKTAKRVEIPVYTDAWMSGDRYGVIVQITENEYGTPIAHVLMDVSNGVRKVVLNDCKEVAL